MFGLIKDWYDKLILWIDWPPPKSRPGIRYVHWEFLGDILDDLTMLTDQETGHFSEREFSDPEAIRELIRSWITPRFLSLYPRQSGKNQKYPRLLSGNPF